MNEIQIQFYYNIFSLKNQWANENYFTGKNGLTKALKCVRIVSAKYNLITLKGFLMSYSYIIIA